MLIGMAVRPAEEVTHGFNRAVKATFPAVDVLPVDFILNGSISNPILLYIVFLI